MVAEDGDAGVGIEQVSGHRGRPQSSSGSRGCRALIGPVERGIINANRLEKVFRPVPGLDRLENDGVALATDGYGRGCKTEFLGQRTA